MPPSAADRLEHLSDALTEIRQILEGMSFADFAAQRVTRLAVERLLEVVSEAARKLPDEIKAARPDIPWRQIADLGNQLRHAYHRVDAQIVWEIWEKDLAALESFVETAIQAFE